MAQVKMPAGKYYIGDPCYVISGSEWSEFLDPYWSVGGYGGVFDYDGLSVCVFQTKYGDGRYEASDGAMLGVDAGIIGAVPMELCKGGDLALGTIVEFHEPFECARDYNGLLRFGNVTVMTGDDDDWDDEEEDGW